MTGTPVNVNFIKLILSFFWTFLYSNRTLCQFNINSTLQTWEKLENKVKHKENFSNIFYKISYRVNRDEIENYYIKTGKSIIVSNKTDY